MNNSTNVAISAHDMSFGVEDILLKLGYLDIPTTEINYLKSAIYKRYFFWILPNLYRNHLYPKLIQEGTPQALIFKFDYDNSRSNNDTMNALKSVLNIYDGIKYFIFDDFIENELPDYLEFDEENYNLLKNDPNFGGKFNVSVSKEI